MLFICSFLSVAATTAVPPLVSSPMPMVCTAGKEYRECGPVCQETCGTLYGDEPRDCFSLRCFSGCFCPEGTIEHESECIKITKCPSKLQ